jgi:hypothetical protein
MYSMAVPPFIPGLLVSLFCLHSLKLLNVDNVCCFIVSKSWITFYNPIYVP